MSLFAAIDAAGVTKYIGDVPRGAACACFCPACGSPLVAKQGGEHTWHFAHEASQERPQCLPGSINLLRRLAIETFTVGAPFVFPIAKALLVPSQRYSEIFEEVSWSLPAGKILDVYPQSHNTRPAVHVSVDDVHAGTVAIWVMVGEYALPEMEDPSDCGLILRCPEPQHGQITTQESALDFLSQFGKWIWRRAPDTQGLARAAHERTLGKLAQHEVMVAKQQAMQLAARREWERTIGTPLAGRDLGLPEAFKPADKSGELPNWVEYKKPNSSFFAYKMRDSEETWVLMASAKHAGYFIVPGAGNWEGWDESLPPSLGEANLDIGAYIGQGPMDHANEWLRARGTAGSRIDSDPYAIRNFVGWQPA
jgi:hypothetical protein